MAEEVPTYPEAIDAIFLNEVPKFSCSQISQRGYWEHT